MTILTELSMPMTQTLSATHLRGLPELWVRLRTEQNIYLHVHQIVSALGLAQCRALRLISIVQVAEIPPAIPSSLARRLGSRPACVWISLHLRSLVEKPSGSLSDDVIKQARPLTIVVYTSKADHPEDLNCVSLECTRSAMIDQAS